MSVPSPDLTPPSLATYQMSYGGLAFGGLTSGATYQLQGWPEGLGSPDYISGDVQRALDQGEYAGLDLSPGRNITVNQVIQAATPTALDTARQALTGVLGPKGTEEEPLYIQLPSGLFACVARPRKHSPPWDIKAVLAHAQEVATLFHASDPRWYAMPSKSATVGLPEASGGVRFPTTFPTTFTGGGTAGILAIANEGKFEMRPVFIITGPCTNPKIANLSLPGSPAIAFTLTLNAGDTLTIDMNWQSVVLVTAGSTAGSSRRASVRGSSTWFNCPPGASVLAFTTEDSGHVAGTLTVQYADAYIGI